jgi:autoinducer 2-degrading protein
LSVPSFLQAQEEWKIPSRAGFELIGMVNYLRVFGEKMHVTLVHVHVKPECVDDFIAATRANHEHSVREPGNRRFDVLQSEDDRTRFVLYETYATEADAALHKETPHYLKWRDTVAGWMAEPRQGVRYAELYPP